ncbi:hypothetical protein SEVIR_3G051300v4 [Setaria viridis]|uniref:Uncharacterized protein n=3 Tax=Setaria TaxID=4554 RepID=A0A368QBW5_SETIT|nr:UPF0481 protein At3g47200 [Setaria italica]XP_034588565.1 UPF0481 protein At3g47200-like [Setaria viridis]RCV15362.1 hypothetical protein SETIT_3G050800v2 [Setaria italica]TKW24447.1 hypothetical protein SEVIR_3G051300v2 [Setaria viridis]
MPAMDGDDLTSQVNWVAWHLTQQLEEAAATEQHRIMVNTHPVSRVSRVPDHLRVHNRDAYTPGLVAIGPLHSKDAERRLRPGNQLKRTYLNSLISRGHPDASRHDVIQGYVRLVAARKHEAHAMYAAEDFDGITDVEFIQMLVLDGCFIIEHLVNVTTGKDEPLLHATPFGPVQLSVDLVLAENQIPFFVLVDLISSSRLPEFDSTGYDPPVLLMKLVLYYLGGERGRDMSEALPPAKDVCHILHVLHAMVVAARTRWEPPPRMQDSAPLEMMQEAARLLRRLPLLLLVPLLYPILPEERRWRASYGREDLPSASDLKRMWVRFKKVRGGSGSKAAAGIASVLGPVPLTVKLAHEDRLRLPQLRIEFRTAPLLLNLMAFEQSAEQRAGDVSAYVWLMAKLVQSAEDAGVLVAAEVVHGGTTGNESKEDVACFFRQMGSASEAAGELEKSYLRETLQKLRERSQDPLFMMWADVQRNYFTVPWAVVAEFVTFFTFISTILQTYGSFKH